jgi:multiple sugar transport system substrate-binding protein
MCIYFFRSSVMKIHCFSFGLRGLTASLLASAFMLSAHAQTVFVSTQLTPEKELSKLKDILLKGTDASVQPESPVNFAKRLPGDLSASPGKVHVLGALAPELVNQSGLMPLDAAMTNLSATRSFYKDALREGRVGGKQQMVPWMHTSFFIVANKKALPYLPPGANTSELSYAQWIEWGKAMKAAQGAGRIGLPAGNGGLIQRFVQGYAYPSYTGAMVKDFRSSAAVTMWEDLRKLWEVSSPDSVKFDSMSDALLKEQVWVGFDHAARLFPALNERPQDFVVIPAPVGPKGRGFFYVLAGLAIPANTPDRAASNKLIEHLASPEIQAITFRETGFFPVVSNSKADALSGNQRLVQVSTMAAMGQAFSGKALVSAIPVSLGAQGGKFNDVYRAAFKRIAIDGENAKTVLDQLSNDLNAVLKEANVPCWGLDARNVTAPATVKTTAGKSVSNDPKAKGSVCAAS